MSILTYFSGMLLFTFIFYAVTITGMGLMYNYYGKSELVSALVRVISCMSLYNQHDALGHLVKVVGTG